MSEKKHRRPWGTGQDPAPTEAAPLDGSRLHRLTRPTGWVACVQKPAEQAAGVQNATTEVGAGKGSKRVEGIGGGGGGERVEGFAGGGNEGFGGGVDGIAEDMEKIRQLSASVMNLSAAVTASNDVTTFLRSELDSRMNEGRMILAELSHSKIVLPENFDDSATLKFVRDLGFEGKFFSHDGGNEAVEYEAVEY